MRAIRPFKSELVISERVSQATLKAYYVGFDQNRFRLQPLVDIIRSVIPEFALGYHCGHIPQNQMIERLKQAAKTVYTTDKYQSRGEFGELILHLLLRDFHNSTPLVSKIYFKDARNVNVHGFDGVHVTNESGIKKLWLGESKLYANGRSGIKELADDIKKHVNADYLQQEFSLISRKIPEDFPDVTYWLDLMDEHQKLDVIFSKIVIPMVCTYSSNTFTSHNADTAEYLADFIKESEELHNYFNSLKVQSDVEIILMLLPVPNKDELNSELDKRLKAMQMI